jgi:hypothetical protein
MTTTIDGSAGITTNAGGVVNPSTNVDGINYSCRAWINFNGVTTATVRGSGNATVVRNSVGDYTVTFTTPMTDANYASLISVGVSTTSLVTVIGSTAGVAPTASALRFSVNNSSSGAATDATYISVAIFR